MTASRRPPREPRPSAMAGRTVFVVLVAVGVGLLILRFGFAESGGASVGGSTTTAASSTTVAGDTTTTTISFANTQVLVANGSGVGGAAGRVTDTLSNKGYSTLPATNATQSNQATSSVYYQPGYEAQAGK